MRKQRGDESASCLASRRIRVAAHAHPCFDEWPDQPRPYRPLVIGGIPRSRISFVARRIAGLFWSERPEPHWRHEMLFDGIDDSPRTASDYQPERESAHSKNLVRAEGVVACAVYVIDVHHVG